MISVSDVRRLPAYPAGGHHLVERMDVPDGRDEARAQLGLNLRSARDAAGLKQREVAEATGLPESALSDYERGARAPNIFTLIAIADVYGISLDRLVRGREAVAPERDTAPSADELAAVRALLRSARRILANEEVGLAATTRAVTSLEAAEMLIEEQPD
jgi:transcriptional regulator with XRE-family HTH domain